MRIAIFFLIILLFISSITYAFIPTKDYYYIFIEMDDENSHYGEVSNVIDKYNDETSLNKEELTIFNEILAFHKDLFNRKNNLNEDEKVYIREVCSRGYSSYATRFDKLILKMKEGK